jgi:hypothetical protein
VTTTWRTTKPDRELDFRCDCPGCDKPANTVHFLPWVTECEEVAFACTDHDPGGYWTEISTFWDPSERFPDHVAKKVGGDRALALLADRVDVLRRVAIN